MVDTARFLSINDRWLPGVRQTLTPAGGVGGVNLSLAVPGGEQWRIIAAHYSFVASAAVGNRFVGYGAFQGDLTIWESPFTGAIPASAAIEVDAGIGYSYYSDIAGAAIATLPLLPVWLTPGMSFGFDTDGTLAGDQVNGISVTVERLFITNEEQSELVEERYEQLLAGRG